MTWFLKVGYFQNQWNLFGPRGELQTHGNCCNKYEQSKKLNFKLTFAQLVLPLFGFSPTYGVEWKQDRGETWELLPSQLLLWLLSRGPILKPNVQPNGPAWAEGQLQAISRWSLREGAVLWWPGKPLETRDFTSPLAVLRSHYTACCPPEWKGCLRADFNSSYIVCKI